MWLRSPFIQRFGGGWMEQFGLDLWSWVQLNSLGARKPSRDVRLLRRIRCERKCLNSAFECYNVLSLARAAASLPGDFAEVGVYQGATAKLISEVKGDKTLHLFDTFQGLPPDGENDAGVHRENEFACGLEKVQKYLMAYPGLRYHVGKFPDSTADLPEQQYAFVHFDVDLYEGTYACLDYFYPRMVPGGMLLSHDYSMLDGVEKAFHDFMADKPEPILEQPTTQGLIIKQAPHPTGMVDADDDSVLASTAETVANR